MHEWNHSPALGSLASSRRSMHVETAYYPPASVAHSPPRIPQIRCPTGLDVGRGRVTLYGSLNRAPQLLAAAYIVIVSSTTTLKAPGRFYCLSPLRPDKPRSSTPCRSFHSSSGAARLRRSTVRSRPSSRRKKSRRSRTNMSLGMPPLTLSQVALRRTGMSIGLEFLNRTGDGAP